MKKIITIILIIIIAIIICLGYNYYNYKIKINEQNKQTSEFKDYVTKEISGVEVATFINKIIDKNTINNIQKDEQGNYIQNEQNSIKLEIKFLESEDIYTMEQIEKAGMENFLKNYGSIKFKAKQTTYHEQTNNIKYIYIEEI